jgi:hypothetical protein
MTIQDILINELKVSKGKDISYEEYLANQSEFSEMMGEGVKFPTSLQNREIPRGNVLLAKGKWSLPKKQSENPLLKFVRGLKK